MPVVPGFHGRQEELAWLKGLFDQATGGSPGARPGGPRMAVVAAESGYGKSRLVQALYQMLSDDPVWDPPKINYWPDTFREQQGQLRVNPDMAGHEPQGPPRFLWLGMRWHATNVRNVDERVCQLPEARHALQAHVETARAREGAWASLMRKTREVVTRQATDEAAGQFIDALIPFGGLIRKAVDSVREIARHQGQSGLNAGDRAESMAKDAGEEMLDCLREVFRGPPVLPVVLWLDDAQWIDGLTRQFLRSLWVEGTQKGWPLLVVVTHWEREWRELLRLERAQREASLAFYDSMVGVSKLYLGAAEGNALAAYLEAQLPGLTADQRKLLQAKAGGNFLSMVENVGYLKKTLLNFVDRDASKPLAPAGENKVKSWSEDRRRRVEQRFEELGEEVKLLLGWGSHMGVRFVSEVVTEFAKTQGVTLEADSLLNDCVNPLAILGGEQNRLLREFRDRAFFEVATRHFANYGAKWEDGLKSALVDRFQVWLDQSFTVEGEICSEGTDSLMGLDGAERRDLLSMAVDALAGNAGNDETIQAMQLRVVVLQVMTDASDNLWSRVRNTGASLEQINWHSTPMEQVGGQVRQELTSQLMTAGLLKPARQVAESLVALMRNHHANADTPESLWNLSASLRSLGDIEKAEGNLQAARALFEDGLQIARTLQGQLGTPESLRDVSVSLGKLGDIEQAEGNLPAARALFEELLQTARTLQSQLGTPESLRGVSVSLERLGDIEKAEGNLPAARALFEELLQTARTL
ncbi:MAG: hypothetical protein ACKO26_15640, partial [Planctomycetota bacterium]